MPCARAMSAATANRWPRSGPSASAGAGTVLTLPERGLRAHEEADDPDRGGHGVAHVALPPRAGVPRCTVPVAHGRSSAEQATQVRGLDEEGHGGGGGG